MDIYVFVLRLIHVFSGVFWAGSAFFFVSVLVPTVQVAGPDGGKFMQHLAARGAMSSRMGIASLLTALSGLLLLWRLYAVAGEAFFRSGPGIVLAIGSLAGLAAFLHGFFGTRRLSDRAGALAREMMARQGPPDAAQVKEAQGLAGRLARSAVMAAVLLVVAVIGMGTAEAFSFNF